MDLSLLCVWEILEEYPSFSDHKLILIEWEGSDIPGQRNKQAKISGWSIKNLFEDNKLFKTMQSDWKRCYEDHQLLDLYYTK